MGNTYSTDMKRFRRTGVARDEYDRILEQQDFKCAICGLKYLGGREFPMDHDHKTGEARGILCTSCNLGLGSFKDSPRLLAHALVYLELHGKTLKE